MGGALAALGTSTAAIYQNPANMPLARMYHFEALTSFAPEAGRQSYGGAVEDSATNRLAGGLAYAWTQYDPQGVRREWHDLRVALGFPLAERVSIGGAFRYLHVSQPISRGPFGASLASDGTATSALFNTATFDLGASVGLGDHVRVGAVGKNLTNTGTGLAPLLFGGGVGVTYKDFSVEVDTFGDFTTWGEAKVRVGAGAEVFVLDRLAIRGGYRFDQGLSAHSASAGLGYIDRKWSVEGGVRREFGPPNPITMIGISARFFYDGARLGGEDE